MECARVDRSLEATFHMLRKVDIQEQAQRMAEAARAGRTHEAGAAGYGEGKGGPQQAAARVSVTSSSAAGGGAVSAALPDVDGGRGRRRHCSGRCLLFH